MLPISSAAWSRCPQVVPSQTFIAAMSSRAAHDRLADQEPGRELDVVPRGAHGHGERRAVDPDAERLLGREQVGPAGRHARARQSRRAAAVGHRDPHHAPRAVRPDKVPPLEQVPFISAYAGQPAEQPQPGPSRPRQPAGRRAAAARLDNSKKRRSQRQAGVAAAAEAEPGGASRRHRPFSILPSFLPFVLDGLDQKRAECAGGPWASDGPRPCPIISPGERDGGAPHSLRA